MTFNSLQYFAFFVVVLALYFRFGRTGQNRLMLVAGSVFYGAFDWRFLFLLYGSIAVDYVVGRCLGGTETERSRKLLLATSLTCQLGILGFFKYFNFFADSAESLLGRLGLNADPATLRIVLPVGISFYTFQSLAYVFAVYRRQLPPERNLTTFAAFVAWFPQLVAGPIERVTSLLPQLQRRREAPRWAAVESGVLLIARGLLKKVVIADGVATYVNSVYRVPGNYNWSALVLATVGFAIQVYGDFSGYTDIARGSSRLLGVELRRNFEQPLLSRNMQEFWQRWHTSLNAWFVEHVAQPMGGARRGRVWAAFTVLVIFALVGLWHGAAWHFVAWGVLNGVLVVTWRQLPTPKGQHPMKLRLADTPRIALTFVLFCTGVVFFRAADIDVAFDILERIVRLADGLNGPAGGAFIPIAVAASFLLDIAERRRRIDAIETIRVRMNLGGVPTLPEAVAESPIARLNSVTAGVFIGVLVVAILVFSGGTPTPFIYFQF